MVAIADVSFFVEENDPVDIEAKKEVILSIFQTELFPCFLRSYPMIYVHLFPMKIEKVL